MLHIFFLHIMQTFQQAVSQPIPTCFQWPDEARGSFPEFEGSARLGAVAPPRAEHPEVSAQILECDGSYVRLRSHKDPSGRKSLLGLN